MNRRVPHGNYWSSWWVNYWRRLCGEGPQALRKWRGERGTVISNPHLRKLLHFSHSWLVGWEISIECSVLYMRFLRRGEIIIAEFAYESSVEMTIGLGLSRN
jgi:hypothetical protein